MGIVLLIAGKPAVGKSTVASILSTRLGAKLISVDDIKSTIGSHGKEKNGYLFCETPDAYELAILEADSLLDSQKWSNIIVEALFTIPEAIRRFKNVAERHNYSLIGVFLDARLQIILQRYENRIRSGGHRVVGGIPGVIHLAELCEKFRLEELIHIDSTQLSLDAVVEIIEDLVKSSQYGTCRTQRMSQ